MESELEQKLRGIEWQFLDKKLSVIDAAERMDLEIGGVTRVEYKAGLKFKVDNHNKRLALNFEGFTKYQIGMLTVLAYALYCTAQSNGHWKPGEVHAGHGCATKDYMEGIRQVKSYFGIK